jgi:hypothetical protein
LQAPIASPILLLDCSCFYSDCVLLVPLGLWSIKSVLLLVKSVHVMLWHADL